MRACLIAVAVIAAVQTRAVAQIPGIGRGSTAQEDDSADTPEGRPSRRSGETRIPIRSPESVEVIEPERTTPPPQRWSAFPNPQNPSAVALEQPLDPDKYICGRGDTFELNFWGAQNFKLRVTVDIEGRAFIAKVGYVTVTGKTLTEARGIIRQAVRRFYPGLNFDLTLAIPRTFLVNVVGWVNHPGLFTATPVQRVSTVLSSSDNVLSGSRRRIAIRRRDGTTVTADLVRYEQTGDSQYNPMVMDGDIINVPFAGVTVTIAGPVQRPGEFELISTKDLKEALDLAGGFRTDVTYKLPIIIIRQEQDKLVQHSFTFAKNDLPAIDLKNGDIIRIPQLGDLEQTVMLIAPVKGGSAVETKRIRFVDGMTVRMMVETAGPIADTGDLRGAYVIHDDGRVEDVDLERMLVRRDFSGDRPVRIGDTVVIPQKRRSVLVQGSVFQPGVFPWRPAFRLNQYIELAGGPVRNAQSPGDYRLVTDRGKTSHVTNETTIQPGDTIMVPERTFSRSEIVQIVIASAGLVLSAVSISILLTR